MRKEAISEEFCLLIPLKFKIGKKLIYVYEHKKLVFTLCDGDLSFDEILPLLTRFCSTYLYYDNVLEKKLKNLTNQLIKQSNRCFESWTFLLMKETDLIVISETFFLMTTFSNKKSEFFLDLHPFFGWSRFDFIYG